MQHTIIKPGDDLPPASISEASNYAEGALDHYQWAAGTTGSDRQDVKELIAGLLHLLDDTFPEKGERDEPPALVLAEALSIYREDLARGGRS